MDAEDMPTHTTYQYVYIDTEYADHGHQYGECHCQTVALFSRTKQTQQIEQDG
jgi:hypothetical protein